MIGVNHALSGALIGKYLPWPLAIPVAFLSHFVLDLLPHFGIVHHKRDLSLFYKTVTVIDVALAFGIGVIILYWRDYHMFFGGLIACSPDFLWLFILHKGRTFDYREHDNAFSKFHIHIQKFERPWGIAIDCVAAVLMGIYFFKR